MHHLSSNKKHVVLLWLSTLTVTTLAFLPSHQPVQNTISKSLLRHKSSSFKATDRVEPWYRLQMAFDSTAEEINIFEGPMALTKERDACGVGFIANTQSGGTVFHE